MEFNYYYGSQAEQFSFIRIPKVMLTGSSFSSLSLMAKVLYGVLLDRMSLSRKNHWMDELDRVYIVYPIGEIQEDLGFTKRKALDLLKELESFGLIEKRRRGLGLPNILYVKSFLSESEKEAVDEFHSSMTEIVHGKQTESNTSHTTSGSVSSDTSGELSSDRESGWDAITDSRKSCPDTMKEEDEMVPAQKVEKKQPAVLEAPGSTPVVHKMSLHEVSNPALPEVTETAPLEVQDSHRPINKTKESKTEDIDIISHQIRIRDDNTMGWDSDTPHEAIRERIRRQIGYDSLIIVHPNDVELIQGIVDLILEVLISGQPSLLIASDVYPSSLVKQRFMNLNYSQVEYVLECFKGNTTKVRNVKKYLLAALFNAQTTMKGYYRAEVNYHMPEMAE